MRRASPVLGCLWESIAYFFAMPLKPLGHLVEALRSQKCNPPSGQKADE